MVKNMPANAGDAGLIPGLERSPGEVTATHSSILAWKLPWTEEPDGLQIVGLQESDTTEHAHIHMDIHVTTGEKEVIKPQLLMLMLQCGTYHLPILHHHG